MLDEISFGTHQFFKSIGYLSVLTPSFKRELVDERHLNEFFHAETEITGNINSAIDVAEDYVLYLIKYLKHSCEKEIKALTGSVEHLDIVLERGKNFPKIKFSEAQKVLAGIDGAFEVTQTGSYRITDTGERALISKYGDFV